jgi:hypothetical protein
MTTLIAAWEDQSRTFRRTTNLPSTAATLQRPPSVIRNERLSRKTETDRWELSSNLSGQHFQECFVDCGLAFTTGVRGHG